MTMEVRQGIEPTDDRIGKGSEPVKIRKRPFEGLLRVLENPNLSVIEKLKTLASKASGAKYDPNETIIEFSEDDPMPNPVNEAQTTSQRDERPVGYVSADIPSTKSGFMDEGDEIIRDEKGDPMRLAKPAKFFDEKGDPIDLSNPANMPKRSENNNKQGGRVELIED